MKRVKLRKGARHISPEHRGDRADVVEEREMSFGRMWLRLRFEDGCELWAPEDRVEPV